MHTKKTFSHFPYVYAHWNMNLIAGNIMRTFFHLMDSTKQIPPLIFIEIIFFASLIYVEYNDDDGLVAVDVLSAMHLFSY